VARIRVEHLYLATGRTEQPDLHPSPHRHLGAGAYSLRMRGAQSRLSVRRQRRPGWLRSGRIARRTSSAVPRPAFVLARALPPTAFAAAFVRFRLPTGVVSRPTSWLLCVVGGTFQSRRVTSAGLLAAELVPANSTRYQPPKPVAVRERLAVHPHDLFDAVVAKPRPGRPGRRCGSQASRCDAGSARGARFQGAGLRPAGRSPCERARGRTSGRAVGRQHGRRRCFRRVLDRPRGWRLARC
jgi:hypothetical protein